MCAASALREAAEELGGVAGFGHIGRRLEASSSPARGLHDTAIAEQADLVVVGSSHRGPVGRVLLGSIGERLLSGAPSAVAVAPRGHAASESRSIKAIAVAFDGSCEAGLALATAHELAALTGAAVRALIVIESPAAIPGAFVPFPGVKPSLPLAGVEPFEEMQGAEAHERQERAARATLKAAVEALGDGAEIEQQVLADTDPAAAILEAIRPGTDLLVLGSRAYGPLRRALLGSVSVAVLRHAPCPVLVMPRVDDGTG